MQLINIVLRINKFKIQNSVDGYIYPLANKI